MPSKKYALSEEPDFKSLNDAEVTTSFTLLQKLIYAYTGYDKTVVSYLTRIWEDLLNERTDRGLVLESSSTRDVCGKKAAVEKPVENVEKKVRSKTTPIAMRPKILKPKGRS
jgi:hypothetical protein